MLDNSNAFTIGSLYTSVVSITSTVTLLCYCLFIGAYLYTFRSSCVDVLFPPSLSETIPQKRHGCRWYRTVSRCAVQDPRRRWRIELPRPRTEAWQRRVRWDIVPCSTFHSVYTSSVDCVCVWGRYIFAYHRNGDDDFLVIVYYYIVKGFFYMVWDILAFETLPSISLARYPKQWLTNKIILWMYKA